MKICATSLEKHDETAAAMIAQLRCGSGVAPPAPRRKVARAL
jgi:hypothetical protein